MKRKNKYLTLIAISSFAIPSLRAETGVACSHECIAPFGEVLGTSDNVQAYSNCDGNCVSTEDNYIQVHNSRTKAPQKVYSGLKWQCVEYARRWLIQVKGLTFKSVDNAHEIWKFDSIEDVSTHQKKMLLKFKNKQTKTKPEYGDILIWSKDFFITGHIAIVVKAEANRIKIAEANYFNSKWIHPTFSRELLLTSDKNGNYSVHDEFLLGWMRVKAE